MFVILSYFFFVDAMKKKKETPPLINSSNSVIQILPFPSLSSWLSQLLLLESASKFKTFEICSKFSFVRSKFHWKDESSSKVSSCIMHTMKSLNRVRDNFETFAKFNWRIRCMWGRSSSFPVTVSHRSRLYRRYLFSSFWNWWFFAWSSWTASTF